MPCFLQTFDANGKELLMGGSTDTRRVGWLPLASVTMPPANVRTPANGNKPGGKRTQQNLTVVALAGDPAVATLMRTVAAGGPNMVWVRAAIDCFKTNGDRESWSVRLTSNDGYFEGIAAQAGTAGKEATVVITLTGYGLSVDYRDTDCQVGLYQGGGVYDPEGELCVQKPTSTWDLGG
jgi:hypothetical protein